MERVTVLPNGCWEWTGATNEDGYGVIGAGGGLGLKTVHKLSYELHKGPVPKGMVVDHQCHNDSGCKGGKTCPHRRCCNPVHLKAKTRKQNTLEGEGFTAKNAAKTHCSTCQFELTGDNVIINAAGSRVCRNCKIRMQREYRERIRNK